ncbi:MULTISPECIES: hypothetical protein [unclassified Chryseobacterium]|uniref:hypothetical protein n=1 Tax=unclassified Chryseobacterium TaxID=2593645 RepID=UPI0028531DD3|nr:hypothetical protein [Chryseobacterium sp. CFS7]MDR4895100.1 hypothetical protein [Chryseobacterium sp. CFS7]
MEDLQVLDYARVEKAYTAIVLDHAEMIALAIGLGLMFAIFNIIRTIKEDVTNNQVDYVAILRLLRDNVQTVALILFMPIAIPLVETIFGFVQGSLMDQLGSEPQGFVENAKKELSNFFNEDESLNIFSVKDIAYAFWKSVEFFGICIIKPFLILVDQWSYGFALVYRFIFLGMLKMVAGIAIACNIYEPTRKYFEGWVKNMMICYLLIPGFLFVTTFIDLIRETFFQSNVELGIIIMMVFLKIMGYGAVHKFLSSSMS